MKKQQTSAARWSINRSAALCNAGAQRIRENPDADLCRNRTGTANVRIVSFELSDGNVRSRITGSSLMKTGELQVGENMIASDGVLFDTGTTGRHIGHEQGKADKDLK